MSSYPTTTVEMRDASAQSRGAVRSGRQDLAFIPPAIVPITTAAELVALRATEKEILRQMEMIYFEAVAKDALKWAARKVLLRTIPVVGELLLVNDLGNGIEWWVSQLTHTGSPVNPADPFVWAPDWSSWYDYYEGIAVDTNADMPGYYGLTGVPDGDYMYHPGPGHTGPVYGVPPVAPGPYYTVVPNPGLTYIEQYETYYSEWYHDSRMRSRRARIWESDAPVIDPTPAEEGEVDLRRSWIEVPYREWDAKVSRTKEQTASTERGPEPQSKEKRDVDTKTDRIVVTEDSVTRGISDHVAAPPEQGVKERKFIANVAAKSLLGIIANVATEGSDFIDAIWGAIPWKLRSGMAYNRKTKKVYVYKYVPPQTKLLDIYNHLFDVDMDKAIKNVVYNQFQDYVIGRLGAAQQKAARPWLEHFHRPVGYGTGPAM